MKKTAITDQVKIVVRELNKFLTPEELQELLETFYTINEIHSVFQTLLIKHLKINKKVAKTISEIGMVTPQPAIALLNRLLQTKSNTILYNFWHKELTEKINKMHALTFHSAILMKGHEEQIFTLFKKLINN